MKGLKIFYVILYIIIGKTASWSAEEMSIEDKENYQPNTIGFKQENILRKNFLSIAEQIKNSHEKGDAKGIHQAYGNFEKLEHKNEEWKNLGISLRIVKWPSQATWKDAVGGELFFPKKIMDWELAYMEMYLLNRIDTIWAVAIGAKFNHPFSRYYLAKILEEIYTKSTDAEKPDLFLSLYQKAFDDLEKCQETPDVCYILGLSYQSEGILIDRNNDEKAIEYHTKGKDARNRYQVLEIKRRCRFVYSQPSPQEYLDLARTGHSIAYFEAANLLKETDQQLQILNEAVEKGYAPALMEIAEIYKSLYLKKISLGERGADVMALLVKAQVYYEDAGQHGIPEAYVALGETYVGDSILNNGYNDRKKFFSLPTGTIEKAASFFKMAGEAYHPEGWNYLAQLYLNLYQQANNEIEKTNLLEEWSRKKRGYAEELYKAIEKGIALGSKRAYCAAYDLYSTESFTELYEKYGPVPEEQSFRQMIEKFIQ